MKQVLDSYLVQKYPKIFVNRYADMRTTAMCWGFEHGDGWFWLLDQLCGSIQNYIDNNNKYRDEKDQISQVIATQVKEKFGTLNFYFTGGDDTIYGMVHLAEVMSGSICEYCGTTENVGVTSGWISVICKDCHTTSKVGDISKRPWKEEEKLPIEVSKELRKIKIDKLNNII